MLGGSESLHNVSGLTCAPTALGRYGITHTLDQVFDAPPVVKAVLVEEAGLNEAYIGTQYVLSVSLPVSLGLPHK